MYWKWYPARNDFGMFGRPPHGFGKPPHGIGKVHMFGLLPHSQHKPLSFDGKLMPSPRARQGAWWYSLSNCGDRVELQGGLDEVDQVRHLYEYST